MILNCTHLFFEALSSPLRLRIVEYLLNKPATVTELSEKLHAEQSRISHALTALTHCKLVKFDRDGKSRIYKIDQPVIGEIIQKVVDYEKTSCTTCGRLEDKKK